MSQYLMSFAKNHIGGKSDAYLALLWCMYKSAQSKGRYSDHIKVHLTSATDQLLGLNYQRIAKRFKRILDAKPELDWVAPSGLSPLANLQVKNFRGFGNLGSEDKGTLLRFGKIKNIFYAPNGGGKSSLCEALEYATTGHIKEADRRKTKVRQYIARGTERPEVNLVGTDRQPVARSLTWSSCFIDRNRLQEFSLLGSKDTGSAESDVIATLFGLEEFQEVIARFVRPESFNLKSFEQPDLAEEVAVLEREKSRLLQLRNSHSSKIAALNGDVCVSLGLQIHQQDAVRVRYARLAKLAELKIRKVERLKLSKPPTVVPMKRIKRAVTIARRLLLRKSDIEAALLRNIAGVNYRAVYEAIRAIESTVLSSHCPACSTPLHAVAENPFERAKRELQTLGALDQLQAALRDVERRIAKMASGIAGTLTDVDTNTRLDMLCTLPLGNLRSSISDFDTATDRAGAAATVLQLAAQLFAENLAGIEVYVRGCEKRRDEVAQANATVKRLEEHASTMKQMGETLKGWFSDKKMLQQAFNDVGEKLAEIAARRGALKDSEADSARFNAFVRQLQMEYANLYRDLLDYKLFLEKSRIAGIEAKAAEYYKAINDHDDEHERIDSLSFDKSGECYRIKISNADGTFLDAFAVLSEGHLRALGLSLLLAMAEKCNFPLIVFDDVVNAIDSDHRANIIDLFFADPCLRRTQMVVTTHDRLFWERFCIIADRHPQSDQNSSCVLTYTNRGIVMVDHAGGFQEKVSRALGVYDVRQALIYCRVWFESMVLEYCLENSLSITAQFSKSQLKKNIYLQVSLESTFALVEPRVAYDSTHFNLIKKDLVNWGGQNQEHHAFDEGSLNFVHSKTSNEVIRIYDAIRLLECQLFPAKKQLSCKKLLEDLDVKITACLGNVGKFDKAPSQVKRIHEQRLAALQRRAGEVSQELAYVEVCLEGNTE
jgi:DNA sulfur modification protein DndD